MTWIIGCFRYTIGDGIAHLITKESKFNKLVIWHLNSLTVIRYVRIICVVNYACLIYMVEFIKLYCPV